MNIRRRLLLFVFAATFVFMLVSATYAAELQLAGVKLGRSGTTVLRMFGNPNEIRIGGAAAGGAAAAAPTQPGAVPISSGDDESDRMARIVELMSRQAGGAAPGAAPTQPGAQAAPAAKAASKGVEVTWVYRFKTGNSLEIIVSPGGYITQIAAFGGGWRQATTTKGITFGATYKDIVFKYGFPETMTGSSGSMTLGYAKKHRVVFSLVGNSVTGITIGLMD